MPKLLNLDSCEFERKQVSKMTWQLTEWQIAQKTACSDGSSRGTADFIQQKVRGILFEAASDPDMVDAKEAATRKRQVHVWQPVKLASWTGKKWKKINCSKTATFNDTWQGRRKILRRTLVGCLKRTEWIHSVLFTFNRLICCCHVYVHAETIKHDKMRVIACQRWRTILTTYYSLCWSRLTDVWQRESPRNNSSGLSRDYRPTLLVYVLVALLRTSNDIHYNFTVI